MSEKKPKREKGQVHKEIKNFEIRINKFGQLEKSMSNEELNQFLNKNVLDKKLNENEENSISENNETQDPQ